MRYNGYLVLYASTLLLCLSRFLYANETPPWLLLPPTPILPTAQETGLVQINGASIWYGSFGNGSTVIFLHGGLANSDYWANQVSALRNEYRVIVIDSRGHGRSSNDNTALSYHLLADDVVAVMDHLNIKNAAIIGWSDGAIIGLEIAMRYPNRINRLFAFAANYDPSGLLDVNNSPVFRSFISRVRSEREQLLNHSNFEILEKNVTTMWMTQPHYSKADLRSIHTKTWIVDGDHDEAISQEHTRSLASLIPNARLDIETSVSHFAFLQDPTRFNADLIDFLTEK